MQRARRCLVPLATDEVLTTGQHRELCRAVCPVRLDLEHRCPDLLTCPATQRRQENERRPQIARVRRPNGFKGDNSEPDGGDGSD